MAVGAISMVGVGSHGAANNDRGISMRHINVAYHLFCGQYRVSHRVTKNGSGDLADKEDYAFFVHQEYWVFTRNGI